MTRRGAVALLGMLGCLLAGCTSAPPPLVGSGPQVDTVTFPPTTCAPPDGVSGRVRAFLDAYDHGDPGLAGRFFAPTPRFRWYSEPALRKGSAAEDRSTLDAYLAGREKARDQLQLVSVVPAGNGGDFAFTVRRGTQTLPSKGRLDCRTGLFVVWSLGPNPGP
jgi:hypothetical protein